MMKREYGGVVDSQLRVYGVKRLRVVDASIMPMIPGTHTSSTVYAVAEKVSSIFFWREGDADLDGERANGFFFETV